MKLKSCVVLTMFALLLTVGHVSAANVALTGGETIVGLDAEVLGSLGLSISRVSDDVRPGSVPGTVVFDINSRNAVAPALPTTMTYDSDDFLNTVAGTVEHTGSVFLIDDADTETEVGNFTIGFDAARVMGSATGFFVASNVGLTGILFDVGAPSILEPRLDGLALQAPLLVSPELATALGDVGLAGGLIGSAKIEAEGVPEPATLGMSLLGGLALLAVRRRR